MDIGPRVYVVQDRSHKIDVTPAEEYGELVTVFGAHERLYNMKAGLLKAHSALKHFRDQDYILPVGHPLAIGIVLAIASRLNGGRVRTLIFDGKVGRYFATLADLSAIPQREIQL